MKKLIAIFAVLFVIWPTYSQSYAKWDNQKLILDNGMVHREISIPNAETDKIQTDKIYIGDSKNSFIKELNDEFYFEINGVSVDGQKDWKFLEVKPYNDVNQGNGAVIIAKRQIDKSKIIEISITYVLYPQSPVIRKNIGFKNTGSDEFKIESLEIEKLATNFDMTFTWIYNIYGRFKTQNGYIGNYYDPIIVLHEVIENRGLVLGNEVTGVLKRTTALVDGKNIGIGFNPSTADYPLRKWLKPGDSWESPYAFIAPYINQKDPYNVLNTVVPDFVRKYMGIRLAKMKQIPTSVYNTWAPFRGDMTTASVIDVAKNASQCGFQYFVVDAGWNTIDGNPTLTGNKDIDWILNLGDWKEDLSKFPNGLNEVFNEVRKLGMKPGLWISVATSTKNAKVYRDHPDWFVQDDQGKPAFLHDESGNPNQVTACLGSGYFDYIKETILRFSKELGVKYIKLDLSIVTSAYRFNSKHTGCAASGHLHKDREESYLTIYERCFQLFDELHKEAPDLFIDCTFETMGKLQLIDFAMVQHAEGNWMSNIDETSPKGGWRVRQLSWWRSPVIPASSMVVGNMIVDEPNYYLSLLSNSGSMPILLGDTRKLSTADKQMINQWADWMYKMNEKHQIMLYRQDLKGFGEPQEGAWDGFQRINTETKSGGIVGIFRQAAVESNRTVSVQYLEPSATYQIKAFTTGKVFATLSGKELADKGFQVKFEKIYDGGLFEITKISK